MSGTRSKNTVLRKSGLLSPHPQTVVTSSPNCCHLIPYYCTVSHYWFRVNTGKAPGLIRSRLPNASQILILQFAFRELSCTQLELSLVATCSRPIQPSVIYMKRFISMNWSLQVRTAWSESIVEAKYSSPKVQHRVSSLLENVQFRSLVIEQNLLRWLTS